jgi:diadenosine tetraphosphate (Ap4A) HIT family hydrolase
MSGMRRLGLLLFLPFTLTAETGACACNPADPASLKTRECSLTNEASKQPAGLTVFHLKDASPRKPNRTLTLPTRIKTDGIQTLADLSPAERIELWTAAIAKAKELWGNEWGLAYNGVKVRTQCHLHIHVGKLLNGVDSGITLFVNHPSQIPVPRDGSGLWVHPVGRRLKVHIKEQTTETVLLR